MIPEVASPRSSLGARFVAFAGLLVACAATLTPLPAQKSVGGICLICGELGGVDAILNIGLFLPLGLGLGLMRTPWWKGLSVCVALTILIESLQLTAVTGRDASVGDVVTNSLGGAVGLALGRHWPVLITPRRGVRALLIVVASALWSTVSAITAFSLQPGPSGPPFYGQLARQRSGDPPYPGAVTDARLGEIRIPDAEVLEGDRIPEALRAGEPFSIRVTPRAAPSWFSPIARVADRYDVENALIAAIGNDVVFRIRTNASFLRLRPYTVGLPGALQSTGRPVAIAGSFHRANGRLIVTGDAETREVDVVFGLGSGWRLILPFNSVADGSVAESVLDALWFFLWLLPVGYWCSFRVRAGPAIAIAAGVVGVLLGALLLIDFVFQLPAATPDIAGVVMGVASGSLLGRLFQAYPGYQSGRDDRRNSTPRDARGVRSRH